MLTYDESGYDAPMIETQDTADLNDVYAFFDPDRSGSGETAKDIDLVQVLADAEEAGADTTSTVAIDPDAEDVFVFLSDFLATGDGSVVPDNATPAPEEEDEDPPEFGRETQRYNPARHDPMMATVRNLF